MLRLRCWSGICAFNHAQGHSASLLRPDDLDAALQSAPSILRAVTCQGRIAAEQVAAHNALIMAG